MIKLRIFNGFHIELKLLVFELPWAQYMICKYISLIKKVHTMHKINLIMHCTFVRNNYIL